MRTGHKYVEVPRHAVARRTIDATVEEFAAGMRYDALRFDDADAFLEHFGEPWILELHEALRSLLDRERSVIGLGSGCGEHEVLLFRAGYDVTASDVVDSALAPTRELFPGFRAIHLDIFDPPRELAFDDVLVTGLDSYFDSERARSIFGNAAQLLRPGGRLIFALRYHDNAATRVIDDVLVPATAAVRRLRLRLAAAPLTLVRKQHGYRRTRAEIVSLAESAGYRLGRIRFAGFAFETTRIGLDRHAPRLYELLRRADRRLRVLNNVTVFEFLTDVRS